MARYKDAILWLADNDDTDWVADGFGSVSASLVADLFNKDIEQVRKDLRWELHKASDRRATKRMACQSHGEWS